MSDHSGPRSTPDEPSDPGLEAGLTAWFEERGRPNPAELATVRATISGLPARRRRGGPVWIGLAAAAAVAVVVGGILLSSRLAPPSTAGASGDPAAFANDPRLAACAKQHVAEPTTVFEMTHAQWFPLYFPGWWRGAPELEVDDPALVVIGREQTVSGSRPAGSADPADRRGYQMCIAVGPPSGATVHDYGWTRFDRIVPVLSPADVARAGHVDPDVLADPAAWRFPERLAPCGGPTGNELYIFEANPLSDFARIFPAAPSIPAVDIDDSGIVIVYGDPLPLRGRSIDSRTGQPGIHDLCVVFSTDNRSAILPDIDITGFHLRIDGPAPTDAVPTPGPSTEASPTPPVTTPEPGPAWAGDARGGLRCLGIMGLVPTPGVAGTDAATSQLPEEALRWFLESVRVSGEPFPVQGFAEADAVEDARLYTSPVGGDPKAAVVVSARSSGPDRVWFVTSAGACSEHELDPTIPTGRDPFGIWADSTGERVADAVLEGTADCYGGTQIRLHDRLYVRTPGGGVDPTQLEMTWSLNATLPDATNDTGYQSGTLRLFTREDGKAIYVVDGDRVERLPHVIGDEVQRTDCN